MKSILFTSIFIISTNCYSQKSNCKIVSDTLFVYYVEIFNPKVKPLEFWATSKLSSFPVNNEGILNDFIAEFSKDKNYCPDLPDGYKDELFKYYGDSAVKTIERIEREKGNIYELLNDLRKSSTVKEYLLENEMKVKVSTIRRYGSFILKNFENDKLGSNSDEYPVDKSLFLDSKVYIPLVTFLLHNSVSGADK